MLEATPSGEKLVHEEIPCRVDREDLPIVEGYALVDGESTMVFMTSYGV